MNVFCFTHCILHLYRSQARLRHGLEAAGCVDLRRPQGSSGADPRAHRAGDRLVEGRRGGGGERGVILRIDYVGSVGFGSVEYCGIH